MEARKQLEEESMRRIRRSPGRFKIAGPWNPLARWTRHCTRLVIGARGEALGMGKLLRQGPKDLGFLANGG
jgi:hypothetical protein